MPDMPASPVAMSVIETGSGATVVGQSKGLPDATGQPLALLIVRYASSDPNPLDGMERVRARSSDWPLPFRNDLAGPMDTSDPTILTSAAAQVLKLEPPHSRLWPNPSAWAAVAPTSVVTASKPNTLFDPFM
jgi:hypothetical protein